MIHTEDCSANADEVTQPLFATKEDNVKGEELLQLLFKSFALTTQGLLIDHLPGGEYHGVSDPTIIQDLNHVSP